MSKQAHAPEGETVQRRVAESDPCPRCGTSLAIEDCKGVVGKAGVSPIARCSDCGLLWSPEMGWYGSASES